MPDATVVQTGRGHVLQTRDHSKSVRSGMHRARTRGGVEPDRARPATGSPRACRAGGICRFGGGRDAVAGRIARRTAARRRAGRWRGPHVLRRNDRARVRSRADVGGEPARLRGAGVGARARPAGADAGAAGGVPGRAAAAPVDRRSGRAEGRQGGLRLGAQSRDGKDYSNKGPSSAQFLGEFHTTMMKSPVRPCPVFEIFSRGGRAAQVARSANDGSPAGVEGRAHAARGERGELNWTNRFRFAGCYENCCTG
ncbi:hypothetical protein BDI4_750005 [Burkholderia diffusa]|nr:hypothetical protein BDI4_750005 [Burkholderia diffusa]